MPCTWLTVTEVSQHLTVHRSTVQRWIETGKLKASHPSGTRMTRVCLEDLNEFMGVEEDE